MVCGVWKLRDITWPPLSGIATLHRFVISVTCMGFFTVYYGVFHTLCCLYDLYCFL